MGPIVWGLGLSGLCMIPDPTVEPFQGLSAAWSCLPALAGGWGIGSRQVRPPLYPGRSLRALGDKGPALLASWERQRPSVMLYTHSLPLREAESLGGRAQEEGPRTGCITASLREMGALGSQEERCSLLLSQAAT